jgi:outer membrane protein assembly factor BamB
MPGHVQWVFKDGAPGTSGQRIDSAGAVVDSGALYFLSANPSARWATMAVDTAKGTEIWRHTAPNTTGATSPAVYDRGVFYAANTRLQPNAYPTPQPKAGEVRLYRLDADTGAVIWSALMPDKSYVQGPPVVDKDMTYLALGGPFGASVGGIHAVSTHKGHLKWSYTNASCTATNPALGAGADGVLTVFMSGADGARLLILNEIHLYR